MSVWVLEGFSTDSRYRDDVRHREYTTSKKRADLFDRIPKIQFTDSGHGIVFATREHRGPRKPTRRMDYAVDQLRLIKALDAAPLLLRAHLDETQEYRRKAEIQRDEAQAEVARVRGRITETLADCEVGSYDQMNGETWLVERLMELQTPGVSGREVGA